MKIFFYICLFVLVSCSTPRDKYEANAPLAGSANGFMYFASNAGIDYYFHFDKKIDEKWLKVNLVLLNKNKKPAIIKSSQFVVLVDGVPYKSIDKVETLKKLEVSVKEHRPPTDLPLLFTDDPTSESKKLYTNELVLVERYMLDPEISLPEHSTFKTYVLFLLPELKVEKFLLKLNDEMDAVAVKLAN